MNRSTILLFLFANAVALFYPGVVFALDCPKFPEQVKKDWEVEVTAAVGRIGPLKGAELATRTRSVAQDLLAKLPDAGRVYLEQMMYSAYCSALRDDPTIKDSEKRKLLKQYNSEVRKAITPNPKRSERSKAEIARTTSEISELSRKQAAYMEATMALQYRKLEDLNAKLSTLYSQKADAADPDARRWVQGAVEKAREVKKDVERTDELRKQYNEELSKNLIAEVYQLFDYVVGTVDSRSAALQELKPQARYEKNEKFVLFTAESNSVNPYVLRTLFMPKGNLIRISCVPGTLTQGIVSTCPSLEFAEILGPDVVQTFRVIPHYGGATFRIVGNEVQLKTKRALNDVKYPASGGTVLTDAFKNEFNTTFQEFFGLAYAR